MSRLNAELHRLYQPMLTPDGRVRAMALTLGRPADWAALSKVWQAVQSDCSLPAPMIAVSGLDSYQLWFSLEEPAPLSEVQAFLSALQARYLNQVAPPRMGLLPAAGTELMDDDPLPGREVVSGQWSAFVAPDLAPIFAETPWLDIPPSPEGQADLLSRAQRIKAKDWQTVLASLQPEQAEAVPQGEPTRSSGPGLHPRQFLLDVMNNEQLALALRIEAAKALLPYDMDAGLSGPGCCS